MYIKFKSKKKRRYGTGSAFHPGVMLLFQQTMKVNLFSIYNYLSHYDLHTCAHGRLMNTTTTTTKYLFFVF